MALRCNALRVNDVAASWCLKCGEQGRPEPAIGMDEDGEAACIMHSVKDPAKNLEVVKLCGAKVTDNAPYTLPESEPLLSAKQLKAEKEKIDMTNEVKLCACGCGSELPQGYHWTRLRGHGDYANGKAQGNGKAQANGKSTPTGKAQANGKSTPTGKELAKSQRVAQDPPANQNVVTLHLSAAKVEKLLSMLL